MTYSIINPVEIQNRAQQKFTSPPPKALGMEFGDFLSGVSAMTPFAAEFTHQATGSVGAATALNAAFVSFPAAASAFSGAAPSWASAGGQLYSPYGAPWGGQGGIPNLGGDYPMSGLGGTGFGAGTGVSGGEAVPGTNMSQFQLMNVMNQNNLRLIELQALMQSNMQVWNTKSNILSADHRAKMSMIEKFTARG